MVLTDQALHPLHQTLLDLGICRAGSLEPFHDRVRDRDDVEVVQCRESGIVMLATLDHINDRYYDDKLHSELAELGDRDRVAMAHDEDTVRRATQWGHAITNRRWLDIGTGSGAILDRLGGRATEVAAVEPQGEFRSLLSERGYQVFRDVRDAPNDSFDLVTLFHVFEHMTSPLDDLLSIREVLAPGGRVVIEVPHARDFLLSFLGVESFRSFTLWSEHLLLHTRDSLRRFLEAAGFDDVTIRGFQRYPLANHLHWLAEGRPGGHDRWAMLRDHDLDAAYGRKLADIDATDTLIAEAICR
ncbi:MAG: class I SAM-dependent methyltransferase [Acidimicrobiales bacterium]